MIPSKLKDGDIVRIITPARSLSLPWITKELQAIATKRLEVLGLKVIFGKHVNEINAFDSSSIKSRVGDLHEAFEDKTVKLILTVVGGFNSNEILPYLDYSLIKKNPKILCGYSDITALQNAIFTKTGLVTYSGPSYFNFGVLKGFDYTLEYFKKCLFDEKSFEVKASDQWSNDRWANDQENRKFIKNDGMFVLNEGKAEGTIIGGNLVTFHALSGTPFMPSLKNSILFVEEDDEEHLYSFNRNLTTITQNPEFSGVKAIAIGRFQPDSKINKKELTAVIDNNERLKKIPIIGGVDFGHTEPRITFPIGGEAKLVANKNGIKLEITKH
jgi:muramoyltetrapeptide carboxypeptidase LdcA involved in peptidoglycan recycling